MGYMRLREELVGENGCVVTRSEIEFLGRRLHVLEACDRRVLELVYKYGMSISKVAEIYGKNPRTMALRVRRLRKLLAGDTLKKLCSRDQFDKGLKGKMLYEHIVGGSGYRRLAKKYGISEYRVRKLLRVKNEELKVKF